MPKEVRMPDLGTATSEVVLACWFKEEGDLVKRGEPLCVVETDKATSELESVADGVLLRRIIEAGGCVRAGEIIAFVGQPGEEIPAADPLRGQAPQDLQRADPSGMSPRSFRASPIVVNLAARSGVDLARVAGTGPGGQITRDDVIKAKSAIPGIPPGLPRRPLSKNQIGVAKAVSASWRESVPISLWASIRMERAIAIRASVEGERRPSFDSIVVSAAAHLIPDFPNFQCSFDGDALVPAGGVHIAVAISGEDGLILPVVRDADRKSLAAIDVEVRGFAARGAAGGLDAGDLGGATFTVSNLGMMPIDAFTAIIPPGQAAILTVGRVREADRSAQFVLTVDHRFINGKEAASFLTRFKEVLESP